MHPTTSVMLKSSPILPAHSPNLSAACNAAVMVLNALNVRRWCVCLQVSLNAVAVPTDTDRFSLFSHFPVSNGASGLGALQQSMSEQPKSAGYELFGSTGASFTPVNPLLPVSLY